jgi:multiple sugar transport system ATP-binding protein
MNLRTVPLTENGAKLGNTNIPLSPAVLQAARSAGLNEVTLGIRPESFHAADQGLTLEVKLVEELGADAYVYGDLPGDGEGHLGTVRPYIVRFDGRVPPRMGEMVTVAPRQGEEHAFHPETGERLG